MNWRRDKLRLMKADPRVDTYIAEARAFAQPVLTEVRARIQKCCPNAEETIKWNVPFYLQDGKLLASVAAFQKHVKVNVWVDAKPEQVDVTSVAELPSARAFAETVSKALRRIGGESTPSAKKAPAAGALKVTAAKKAPAAAAPKKAAAKKAPATKASATKASATKNAAKKTTPKKA